MESHLSLIDHHIVYHYLFFPFTYSFSRMSVVYLLVQHSTTDSQGGCKHAGVLDGTSKILYYKSPNTLASVKTFCNR